MSDTNRTERRLLDSIRKAKTGSDDQTAPVDSSVAANAANTATLDEQPATRAGSRTARQTKPASGHARRTKTTTSTGRPKAAITHKTAISAAPVETGGAYQSGRRIWPD